MLFRSPYTAAGRATIYLIEPSGELVGSEEAACQALKNQLFLPAIPKAAA